MERVTGETLRTDRSEYRVHELVASGGFGSVWYGRDLRTNTPVAVKRLHPHHAREPRVVQQFEREASLCRGMWHPNVVQVLDQGRDADEVPFIIMEWVTGWTIAEVIAKRGTLPPAEAAADISQALEALEAARQRGVIHRDLKPQNLMVTPDQRVKVMDFGIAKEALAEATGYSAPVGTPAYMAPEQFSAQPLDCRTDLYALGATLYEMLAGQPPFEGPSWTNFMYQHVQSPPPSLETLRPELEPRLAGVVHRALAKTPEERFQTPTEMLAALRTFVGQVTVPIATPPPRPTVPLTSPPVVQPEAVPPPDRQIPAPSGPLAATSEPTPGGPEASPLQPLPPPPRPFGPKPLWIGGLVAVGLIGAFILRRGLTDPTPPSQTSPTATVAAPTATAALPTVTVAPGVVATLLARAFPDAATSTPVAAPTTTPAPRPTATAATGVATLGPLPPTPAAQVVPPAAKPGLPPPRSILAGPWIFNLRVDSNDCGPQPLVGQSVTFGLSFTKIQGSGDYILDGEQFALYSGNGTYVGNIQMSWPRLFITVPDDRHDHEHVDITFASSNQTSSIEWIQHFFVARPECRVIYHAP